MRDSEKVEHSTREKLLTTFVVLVVVVFSLGLKSGISFVYDYIDEQGYIPHTATVDLYMKPDWLVGKNRTCRAYTYEEFGAMQTINCPNDWPISPEAHNVAIKFWGRVRRFDARFTRDTRFEWKCRRESDGFTCWALD